MNLSFQIVHPIAAWIFYSEQHQSAEHKIITKICQAITVSPVFKLVSTTNTQGAPVEMMNVADHIFKKSDIW